MNELRSAVMAVALLRVAPCGDLTGDDRPHHDCFRKAVEMKSEPPIEPSERPAHGHAAANKPTTVTTPEAMIDAGCSCQPEPPEWDGTGRAEAVRGT